MNSLESKTNRERILELITLLEDKETPDFMRKCYSTECEIKLMKYSGKDFGELMDKYLVAKK